MDEPSIELLAKYRNGDEQAASELFRRYVSRLTILARARMAPKIARRFDAEDVVLSAYRSFFIRARNGQFSLARSGDLWRLLVGIVLRKLYRKSAHHTADKRSVDREQALPAGGDSAWELLVPCTQTPTADEAVAMAELVEGFMAELEPLSRQVLEMRLQDHRLGEIAAQTQRSERTIRRILDELEHRLVLLLHQPGDETRLFTMRRTTIDANPDEDDRQIVLDALERSGSRRQIAMRSPEEPVPADDRPPAEFMSDRDFTLQLHLGTGGTGRVYRALQRGRAQPVAVKMLKKARQRDPAAVARFLDEARTVARLDHPGIVGIQGIGRTRGGGYFLVAEFVAGQNLAEVVAGRQVALAEAVRWVAEAAEAIEYSHRRKVIHCDLKPANLMLDGQGHVRVTDFGLAQILNAGGRSGRASIAGTAGYMAPEQLDPSWGTIGPCTDVFGLGAVLFALLVGRPPFTGTTIEELLRTMLDTTPSLSLCTIRSEVSSDVDTICRKCLAIAPRDRFPSAAALGQALLLTL